MIPYYVLVGAPLLFCFLHTGALEHPLHPIPKKNYTIVFFFFLYWLLLSLRSRSIGNDTVQYLRAFELFSELSWSEVWQSTRWEIGFVTLTKLLATISSHPNVYLSVVGALTLYPIARMYFRESEDDLTAMALFLIFPVFIMNFSGLRQGLAIAFTPMVYYATRRHHLWKALLWALAASLFHTSAVALFLLYPVYHMNLRPKHLFWLVPGFLFTMMNNTRLYRLFLPLLGNDYAERYAEVTQTGAYTMILLFSLFIAYSFIAPSEELMDHDTRGMRNILVLVLFIQLFSPISTITMRMNYYFVLFVPLLIGKIHHRWVAVDKRYVYLVQIGMVCFFLLYYFAKTNVADSLSIYPYRFFWQ